MARLRVLDTAVRANTTNFERGMKRARKSLGKFTKSIGAMTGMLGVLSVAGVGLFVRRTMKSIDATAKLAAQIGTTTESLISLRHAAELTGAGAELMDKSLAVMSKRLGEAAGGTGEAKAALDQLNLTTDELLGMDPAEQFKLIADRVSQLATQEEKAAATSDLFSRAGIKMVNTLDLGAKGIDEIHDKLAQKGGLYSRAEAKRVEDANDAIEELSSTMHLLAATLTIEVAPAITTTAKALDDWMPNIRWAMNLAVDQVGKLAKGMALVMEYGQGFGTVFGIGKAGDVKSKWAQIHADIDESWRKFMETRRGGDGYGDKPGAPNTDLGGIGTAGLDRIATKVSNLEQTGRAALQTISGGFDIMTIKAQGFGAVLDQILGSMVSMASQLGGQWALSQIAGDNQTWAPNPFSLDQQRAGK